MVKSDLAQITYHSIKYDGDGEISGVEVAQIIIQLVVIFYTPNTIILAIEP